MRISKSGILLPFSHRETVREETWKCSASCSCVSPFSLRRHFRKFPVFCWSIRNPPFAKIIAEPREKYHDTKRELPQFRSRHVMSAGFGLAKSPRASAGKPLRLLYHVRKSAGICRAGAAARVLRQQNRHDTMFSKGIRKDSAGNGVSLASARKPLRLLYHVRRELQLFLGKVL